MENRNHIDDFSVAALCFYLQLKGDDGKPKWHGVQDIAHRFNITISRSSVVLRDLYLQGSVERFTNRRAIVKYRWKK